MSRRQGALSAIAVVAVVAVATSLVAQQNPPAPAAPVPPGLPDWAYTPPPPPGSPPAPSALPTDDNAIVKIPGTDRTMTRAALRGQKEIVDWYPEERRGQTPPIVRVGRDGVRACGFCHLADG